MKLFRKDKYVGAERIVLGKWFQRNGAAWANERKPFDFLLKNGNGRGLKEEERRECEFNLWIRTSLNNFAPLMRVHDE